MTRRKLDTAAYGLSMVKPFISLNTKLIRYLLSLHLEINCTVLNCSKSELVEMLLYNSPPIYFTCRLRGSVSELLSQEHARY